MKANPAVLKIKFLQFSFTGTRVLNY